MMSSESEQVYWVEASTTQEFVPIWSILMDALSHRFSSAVVDAYPAPIWDSFSELPEPVRQAHHVLEEVGRRSNPSARDPLMAVHVEPASTKAWSALKDFGPYSINAEISDHKKEVILANHDSGSGWVRLNAQDRLKVADSLAKHGLSFEAVLTVPPPEPRKRFFRRR